MGNKISIDKFSFISCEGRADDCPSSDMKLAVIVDSWQWVCLTQWRDDQVVIVDRGNGSRDKIEYEQF